MVGNADGELTVLTVFLYAVLGTGQANVYLLTDVYLAS